MSKPSKPQPWYAAYNQPPRSPKHGRNRKPTPSSHRDPADRTSDSSRTSDDAVVTIAYSWSAGPIRTFTIEPFRAPPIPHAGIRAGELIGYRLWWVTDKIELCSLAHHFIWQPGATIEGNIDEEVDFGLMLFGKPIYGGVYCFASIEALDKEIRYSASVLYPRPLHLTPLAMFHPSYATQVLGFAWGTIKLWGEVVEHERGYRAQFAKLTSLDGSHGAFSLSDLQRKYNV